MATAFDHPDFPSGERRVPSVLVVEDQSVMQDYYREMLSRRGFTVAMLDNADEIMEVLAKLHPDVVVLDIGLPGNLSGLDACKLIRRGTQYPVLIVIATGSGDVATLRYAAECGADLFLKKPFRASDFNRVIDQLLLERGRAGAPVPEHDLRGDGRDPSPPAGGDGR